MMRVTACGRYTSGASYYLSLIVRRWPWTVEIAVWRWYVEVRF